MYKITKNTKVYIGCPPNFASGGPELLHQLCYFLNEKGINAYMFYNCNGKYDGNPVAKRFTHYETTFVEKIEDSEKNIFIVPESLMNSLMDYKLINKCIWWLGINHYLLPTELYPHKYLRVVWHYILKFLGIKKVLTINEVKKQNISNWAQCWYAVSYLRNKGLYNVAYLSDYISEQFIESYRRNKHKFNADQKEDIVLYNPKRNTKYIKKLMKKAPDIKFQAIENMSPEEVKKLMLRAKIYIDFGSHPGKDRIPREAALQGCCVLTSTLGSAGFFDDVPILSEYKFDRNNRNVSKVISRIRYIFKEYEKENCNFDKYRELIIKEKQVFDDDINKLFNYIED